MLLEVLKFFFNHCSLKHHVMGMSIGQYSGHWVELRCADTMCLMVWNVLPWYHSYSLLTASSFSICLSTKIICMQKYFLDERSQCRMARLVWTDRKVTVTQIITLSNCSEERLIAVDSMCTDSQKLDRTDVPKRNDECRFVHAYRLKVTTDMILWMKR